MKLQRSAQGSPESEYTKLLTSYASGLVIKQLETARKMKNIIEENNSYVVETSEGERTTTIAKCACSFFTSICLPCRHMLALRAKLGKSLYDPSICDQRWTSTYYKSTQQIFSNSQPTSSLVIVKSNLKLTYLVNTKSIVRLCFLPQNWHQLLV